MTETFRIRAVQLSDWVALAQLNHEFNGVAMTPEQMAARFQSAHPSELVVVAEMGDRIYGKDAVGKTHPYLPETLTGGTGSMDVCSDPMGGAD